VEGISFSALIFKPISFGVVVTIIDPLGIDSKLPPIFGIWFDNCHDQAVHAGEYGVRLAIEMRIGTRVAD